MDEKNKEYIPAFHYNWLTPFYDFLVRWSTREYAFKRLLIKLARIGKGHRVLDLGCGTATLAILIKRTYPDAEVIGLDGDLRVLEIARAKIARAGLDFKLDHGMAFELPYPDSHFDRVLSSLVFHHLTPENKARTLREVFRALQPGGELHLADFGEPANVYARLVSLMLRRFEQASDLIEGKLRQMIRDAGFEQVEEYAHFTTLYGTISLYKARKPT